MNKMTGDHTIEIESDDPLDMLTNCDLTVLTKYLNYIDPYNIDNEKNNDRDNNNRIDDYSESTFQEGDLEEWRTDDFCFDDQDAEYLKELILGIDEEQFAREIRKSGYLTQEYIGIVTSEIERKEKIIPEYFTFKDKRTSFERLKSIMQRTEMSRQGILNTNFSKGSITKIIGKLSEDSLKQLSLMPNSIEVALQESQRRLKNLAVQTTSHMRRDSFLGKRISDDKSLQIDSKKRLRNEHYFNLNNKYACSA